jgi:deoxyribonuclease V
MPSDLPVPDLYAALGVLLRQIPAGRVATYGGLAEALGNVVAAGWIGGWALDHPHTDDCPCHRVVRKGGDLGGYIHGAEEKARRLSAEGIEVNDGRVDFERLGFQEFQSDRPLERLRTLQEEMARQVSLRAPQQLPDLVAGVDAAYASGDLAFAAYALVDRASGKLVDSVVIDRPIRFPYITTYLSFRELPVLLPLLEEVRRRELMADAILVDGNGRLHQRLAGIASHLGVAADVRTVGIGKKLLCGQVDLEGLMPDESRPVEYHDDIIAAAVKGTPGSKPIFVSVGHQVDLPFAVDLVQSLFHGHRLPQPQRFAHELCTRAARQQG